MYLVTKEEQLILDNPPWHKGFETHEFNAEVSRTSAFSADLLLNIEDQIITTESEFESMLCQTEIWQLSKDHQCQFIFTNPRQALRRELIVDSEFTKGQLSGDFKSRNSHRNYALPQDLEIVFYVNWLGTHGDLILHASGIALDGKGYAFVGPSGIGKSTLVGFLKDEPGVTVLGEDQLVLRCLGGTFWIFGTPWHEDRAMCSPMGVPLEKLFFLERDGENSLKQISSLQGVAKLLQTAFVPYYRPDVVEKILERLDLMALTIPFSRLSYVPGEKVIARIIA